MNSKESFSNSVDQSEELLSDREANSTRRQSPSRFGHFPKYTKPKIGPMYQCAVPSFSRGEDSDIEGGGSGGLTNLAWRGMGLNRPGGRSGGKGRGRVGKVKGRGGRGRGSGGSGLGGQEELMSSGESDVKMIANAASGFTQDNYEKRLIPRGGVCVHRPSSIGVMLRDEPSLPQAGSKNDGMFNPLDQDEEYLIFSRNIFIQTPRPFGDLGIDNIWDTDAERNFGGRHDTSHLGLIRTKTSKRKAASIDAGVDDGESEPSRVTTSRRKSSTEDECKPQTVLSVIEESNSATKTVNKILHDSCTSSLLPFCGLEDDEQMLHFLRTDHNGDFRRAKLSILVNVDRGYGVHRRKAQRKKQKEDSDTFSDPTTFTSESWRWRLHQARPTMLSDLRSCQNTNYQFFEPSIINLNDLTSTELPWRFKDSTEITENADEDSQFLIRTRSCSVDWTLDQIEMAKKIWKCILSFTIDILGKVDHLLASKKSSEQPIENDDEIVNDDSKPLLSDLLTLVTKAHALPTPEETFERRDPSARLMSQNMNAIIDLIEIGRDSAAQLLLQLKDDGGGIELGAMRTAVSELERACPVKFPELDAANIQIEESFLWEEELLNNVNLDADSDTSNDEILLQKEMTLEKVERLVSKGRELTLRPRSLVRLENRVERAYSLRQKIIAWNEARSQENPQNIKFISGLIKEANKIELMFPEMLTLTGVHKKAEEWIDRASIAVRSTISFEELESLVSTGESLPLDVSDLLEKLQTRLKQAQEWIDRVREVVPEHEDRFLWLKRIRIALNDRNTYTRLVSLVSDGSRIPVDIDWFKLLQIEIDARNWSTKSMSWIPKYSNSSYDKIHKRGKIDEVQDHLDKASSLRDRIWFASDEEKSKWDLKGEDELTEMIEMAKSWLDEYDEYINQDNRSKKSRISMSMAKLQTIVEKVNMIPLNLGNSSNKMIRIFSQADEWMQRYYPILERCRIESSYIPSVIIKDKETPELVKLDEVHTAIAEADSNIAFDLDEVMRLKERLLASQIWIEKSSAISSKKKKNNTSTKKRASNSSDDRHSMEDIASLIDEASTLSLDVSEELNFLKIEQSKVMSWRLQMQRTIREIILSFDNCVKDRETLCDKSSEQGSSSHSVPQPLSTTISSGKSNVNEVPSANSSCQNVKRRQSGNNSFSTEESVASRSATPLSVDFADKNNFPLVDDFLRNAKSLSVLTPESYVSEELSGVMSWLHKSIKFISNHAEAFDRKNSSSLDKLIKNGQSLFRFKSCVKEIPEDPSLLEDLRECWALVVNDDLDKLVDLKDKRSKFFEWCQKADEIISDSTTKIPIETLIKLDEQSTSFPSTSDVVIRVRQKMKNAIVWLTNLQELLKSGMKMSIEDAKTISDEGDKLNLTCHELKILRGALRATKAWVTKAKKCGADNGTATVASINELIKEHSSFLVTAIDELDKLKQATCGYCICRMPYEGFMIGCDGCEEWYHGPCVGVSEEQANKVDKYVCLRCSALRIYKENASAVAGVLRKWSSSKGLSKARVMDSQRYSRKVRTCEKDLTKARENLQKFEKSLQVCLSQPYANNNRKALSSDASINNQIDAREDGKTLIEEPQTVKSKDENNLQDKITKIRTTIENCEKRMDGYRTELAEKSNIEARENSVAVKLKKWCVAVKREVLSPNTNEDAELSRPRGIGHTSAPMKNAEILAETLGIANMPDISMILNSFKIFSWCLQLLEVLMRKPTVEEIRSLLSLCDSNEFRFPESKCVRMLRSISSRAQIWQSKVKKALVPDNNENAKPFDLELLKDLLVSGKQIPLAMPEEAQLWSTIEDKGQRHCICGGPSDGSFMLCCDNCDRWFHGVCMKLDKAATDSLTKWICPLCKGIKPEQLVVVDDEITCSASEKPPMVIVSKVSAEGISPHAPDSVSLWPPFGLRSSASSVEALGQVGDSDNDDFTPLTKKSISAVHISSASVKTKCILQSDAQETNTQRSSQIMVTTEQNSATHLLYPAASAAQRSSNASEAAMETKIIHKNDFGKTMLQAATVSTSYTPQNHTHESMQVSIVPSSSMDLILTSNIADTALGGTSTVSQELAREPCIANGLRNHSSSIECLEDGEILR